MPQGSMPEITIKLSSQKREKNSKENIAKKENC